MFAEVVEMFALAGFTLTESAEVMLILFMHQYAWSSLVAFLCGGVSFAQVPVASLLPL